MAQTIIIKNGTGSISNSDVVKGEPAINTTTGNLYYGDTAGNVSNNFAFGHITASGDISSSGTGSFLSVDIASTVNSTGPTSHAALKVAGGVSVAEKINTKHLIVSQDFACGNNAIFGNAASDQVLIYGTVGTDINSTANISASGYISASNFVGDGSQITGVTGEWDGTHTGTADFTGNITASGHISASGVVNASALMVNSNRIIKTSGPGAGNYIFQDGGIYASGEITASGIISASGDLYGDDLVLGTGRITTANTHIDYSSTPLMGITNISASGHISASGNLRLGDGTNLLGGKRLITNTDSYEFRDGKITALSGFITSQITASGDISSSGDIFAADYFDNGTNINTLYSPRIGSTAITTLGTIAVGTWASETAPIASAYLDADTAHLSSTQTFLGAKTFTLPVTASSNISSSGTVTANAFAGHAIHINSATGFINATAAAMDNAKVHLGSSNYGHTDARDYGVAGGTVTVSSPSITDEKQFMGIIVPVDLKSVTIKSQGRFQNAAAKMRMCLFTSSRQEGGTPASITLYKILEVETDSSNTWGMFRNMDGTATVDIDAGSIIYVGFGRTEGSTAQKPRINYTLTGITR